MRAKHDNQDSALSDFRIPEGIVFAVADGVGGAEGGKLAADTAIATTKEFLLHNPHGTLENCFSVIKSRLDAIGKKNKEFENMSTTLTVCIVRDRVVEVGHVGDSRVYHLRGHGLMDRTKDQTEIQKLIDQGVLTRTRAKRYHRKHVLLSALSASDTYDFYGNKFEVIKGDRMVLMTDGVYNILPRRQIRDLSLKSETPMEFLEIVKKTLEEHGTTDDYTAICAQFDGD